MHKFKILKYYSKPEVQEYMARIAKNREVVGTYLSGSYSKRPDVLSYPRDVVEKVKDGIVAFHCSVERWKNTLALKPELSEKELAELRIGWDVIIDIDAKAKVEHAAIAAKLICEFLEKDYGITPGVKFSGRRGFHIAVAFEALPKKINFTETRVLYPELLRAIAMFIREKLREKILEELIKFEGGVAALIKTVGSISELSPFEFLEIEKDWGIRHLFRMPFSLHNKTYLVSLPLAWKKLDKFVPENAKPENISKEAFEIKFLDNKEGEASQLAVDAFEWWNKLEKSQKSVSEEIAEEMQNAVKLAVRVHKKIPEELFPPCIKKILSGLEDGRKRSIFTLVTFLRNMGWSNEEIEEKLYEWNSQNAEPLRENYIRTQLKWHFRQKRNLLPANCGNELFYGSIDVCEPDKICELIKNPVTYPFKLLALSKKKKQKKRRRKRK